MRIEKQESDRMVLVNKNNTPLFIGIFLIIASFFILKDLIFNRTESSSFWTLLTLPVGFIFILYRKITAIILNKKIGKIFIVEKRTFGKKRKQKLEMNKVDKVFLLVEKSKNVGSRDDYQSIFSFVTNDGLSIPFFIAGRGVTRVNSKKVEKHRTLGPQIASFLDVSYEESVPVIKKRTRKNNPIPFSKK